MTLREFSLLAHACARSEEQGGSIAQITIPSGDDMAMLRLPGLDVLVAVDQTIDGRHVELAVTPIPLIARKAINRCVSDVAAMAARPCAALVAGILPVGFSEKDARVLIDALHEAAVAAGAPIIGGDLAVHREPGAPLTLSVTVLAVPGPQPPVLRRGAQAGDLLAVTGVLGGAWSGGASDRHLSFTPRVAEALELSDILKQRLHAMIDISDGLGRDLSHLLRPIAGAVGGAAGDPSQSQSNGQLRFVIDEAALPCAPGATIEQAVADGEDYELLLSAEGPLPRTLGDGVPLTVIGRVELGAPGVFLRRADGSLQDISGAGWQHGT